MFSSFTERFFVRKKRRQKAIKIILISLSVIVLFFLIVRVANIFVLGKIASHTFEKMKQNKTYLSVKYDINRSFLKQKVFIKNVKIQVNAGDVLVDNIELKTKKGLIFPDEITLKIGNVKSIDIKRSYEFKVKEGEKNFTLKINNNFFQKPTFGGFAFDNPMTISIIENNNEVGLMKVDIFDYTKKLNKDNEGIALFKSKASVMFHNVPFIPYITLSGRPLSWDIDSKQVIQNHRWGINNSRIETISDITFNKFIIDHSFSKFALSGKLKAGREIKTANAQIVIDNYRQLIRELFNLMMASRPEKNDMHKKVYNFLSKDLLPFLKNKNTKSTNNKIVLDFLKTQDMDFITINDVSINKIAEKFYNKLN